MDAPVYLEITGIGKGKRKGDVDEHAKWPRVRCARLINLWDQLRRVRGRFPDELQDTNRGQSLQSMTGQPV